MTPAELISARKAMNLTQEAMAKLVGKTSRSVRRWESGASPVPQYVHIIVTSAGGKKHGNA